MHADNKRMESWIETRLWNSRFTGQTLSTLDLVRSMSGFFNIQVQGEQLRKIQIMIARIRDRVDKRFQRYLRIRKRLTTEWMVPPELIDRWHAAGWIDMAPQILKKLTKLFIERDFTRMIEPEVIPIDSKLNIWD